MGSIRPCSTDNSTRTTVFIPSPYSTTMASFTPTIPLKQKRQHQRTRCIPYVYRPKYVHTSLMSADNFTESEGSDVIETPSNITGDKNSDNNNDNNNNNNTGKTESEKNKGDELEPSSNEGEKRRAKYMQLLRDLAEEEEQLGNPNPLGEKMSHEVVSFDEDGNGPRDRYVYVEERDCIGCTFCASSANGTFFMEPEHGRARVFDQTGDSDENIDEAVKSCPVNCIYYVDWEDLVSLELNRREQVINNWARLVGGQDFSNSKTGNRKTTVMDSGIIRCTDCPSRGCKECPMYGVGENPEYLRKKKAFEAKKKARKIESKRKRRAL